MKAAKQQVQVAQGREVSWISLREYLDGLDFTKLIPMHWPLGSGVREVKCFHASGIIDCDPGGPTHGGIHSVDSQGYVLQTEREFQYSRWKKGNCAYIYYAGPTAGLYLMLPKPLKVSVEVKVQV
jgi:hypothetical protein